MKKLSILKIALVTFWILWSFPFIAHYIRFMIRPDPLGKPIFFGFLGLLYWLFLGIGPSSLLYFIIALIMKRKK